MSKNRSVLLNLGGGVSLMVGAPSISTWKTQERPENAKRGTFGFNTQTNKLEYFNGTDWFEALMEET